MKWLLNIRFPVYLVSSHSLILILFQVVPACAIQGLPEGHREEAQGGLHPAGDQDQDRDHEGQGVVKR